MPVRNASITSVVLVLISMIGIAGVVAVFLLMRSGQSEPEQPLTVHVIEGPFEAQVLDQGTVESSKNISIECEIESSDYDGTPILEVMDEGTEVKPGDIVAKFDPAKLKEQLQEQKIKVNDAKSKVAEAQSALDAATEETEEFFSPENGMLARDKKKMEIELIQAEKEEAQASEYLEFSRRLRARGYITESAYRQDRQSLEQAKSKVELFNIELGLLDRTAKRKKIEFDSKIDAAKVTLENAEKTCDLEIAKQEKAELQIEKCNVVVPEGVTGKLVYPERWDHRNDKRFVLEPGAKIREKQTVVLIPNPSFMQVKASVNESRIVAVKQGLPVTIKIDALKDQPLTGVVDRVGQFAEDQGWRSSNVNEYPVVVRILNPPHTLRSGMNASIAIEIESKASAIQVPFLAVTERNGRYYCLVKSREKWEAREVKIGSQNDKMLCIDSGLQADETLALNPGNHEELAALPKRVDKPVKLEQEVSAGSESERGATSSDAQQ